MHVCVCAVNAPLRSLGVVQTWHGSLTSSPIPACRLARAALDREDPGETFLKTVPTQPEPIDFIHPARWGADMGDCPPEQLDGNRVVNLPAHASDYCSPFPHIQDIYQTTLVRRRLRHMVFSGQSLHRQRMLLWGLLGVLPQLPILVGMVVQQRAVFT